MKDLPIGSNSRRLRVALLANAAFSLTTGFCLVLFSDWLAPLLGENIPAWVLVVIGAGLVPFGGLVAWLGSRRQPDTLAALAVSAGDLAWVAGSGLLLVLASHQFSATGMASVIVVAASVGGFALGQLRGIAAVFAADPADRSRFRVCFDIQSNGHADEIWKNVTRLGEIARFAPSLLSSSLRDGKTSGVGAIRDCSDLSRRRWSERCTALNEENRELVMEFLTQEPGFPFPFTQMTGGWAVRTVAGCTLVRVWWEGIPKYPMLNPIILPLLAWQARRQFPVMVRLMAGQSNTQASGPALLTVAPC